LHQGFEIPNLSLFINSNLSRFVDVSKVFYIGQESARLLKEGLCKQAGNSNPLCKASNITHVAGGLPQPTQNGTKLGVHPFGTPTHMNRK